MGLPQGQTNNQKGRPKGSRNKRTEEWEELGQAICSGHSEQVDRLLNDLWNGDLNDRAKGAELYLKLLSYFKPKHTSSAVENLNNPIEIIISKEI